MADAINYLSHFKRWKNWRNFPANTLSNTLKVQLAQDVKHLALYHRWIPNRNFINRIHITKQSSDTFEIVHGRYDVVSSRENFNFNLIFFVHLRNVFFEQLVAFGYFQVITFIGLCGVLGSSSTAWSTIDFSPDSY